MSDSAIGIIGSDHYTPLYQPDGRWAIWSIHEIYRGAEGQNKFIPKINDFVIEPETGKMFRVTSLDLVTYIPQLSPVTITQEVTIDEIISSTNGNFRLYYDRSVSPYTLAVDGFVRIYSTSASYARIYRGHFIDSTKIISRRYNNSGALIGMDVPLDLVAFNTHDNHAVKSVQTCNTDVELVDGETCTLVVFDSSGKVLSRATLLAEETTYVAQAFAEQKFITNIFLKSAFINDTSVTDIQFPVNLPIQSFSPIGVVQYNDGSQVEYPVDGDKFTLYGLDQFVSTIIGHRVPLTLKYRMAANEAGLATVSINHHEITRPYNLYVSSPNTSYNAKLYVYPVWVDELTGYHLKTYLTNLDRNIMIDVSNIIGLASNSPAFNSTAYGITQRLIFTLDLANASSIFSHFQHVQTVDIILRGPASDSSLVNIWETASQVPTPTPYYGTELRATRDLATQTKVYIGNNIDTKQNFINKLYKTTNALYNPVTETSAPIPTHMEVSHQLEKIIVPMDNYNDVVQFSHPVALHSNVDITFLRQSSSGYLKLSVCALTVR